MVLHRPATPSPSVSSFPQCFKGLGFKLAIFGGNLALPAIVQSGFIRANPW